MNCPSNQSKTEQVRVERIKSPLDILHHWLFFDEGLANIAERGDDVYDHAAMLKTLCFYAANETRAYIVIGYNKEDVQTGFAVFEESTPLFHTTRSFIVRAFYTRCGNEQVTVAMLRNFEHWGRANGVTRLIISTRRHSGAAIRYFQSEKFGFTKTAIIFEKEL